MTSVSLLLISCLGTMTASAMQPLDDRQMREISGAGVGFFIDALSHEQTDAVTDISGLTDSRGRQVGVQIDDLYIKGQNSERGSLDTKASLGNSDHPFTVSIIRQAQKTDNNVLRIATPSWADDPINDSRLFGIWSYYQGCLFGENGCNDPTIAITNINDEIHRQYNERNRLLESYPNGFYILKIGIDEDMAMVRYYQTTLNDRTNAARTAYSDMEQAYLSYGHNDVKLGERVGCLIFCSTEARTYNQTIDRYEQRVGEMTQAQKSLSIAWNADRNGQTLAQRVQDYEAFNVLCGTPAIQNTCENGRIGALEKDRDNIQKVADALNNNSVHDKNLDVGVKTKITAPHTIYTNKGQAVGEIVSTAPLTLDIEGMTLNNSHIELWAEDNRLNAEAGLQLYMDKMAIGGCQDCSDESRAVMKNVYIDLNLGQSLYQPATIEATTNNNLQISLPGVTWENREDFYENVPKSNITIGNMLLSNKNIGSQVIRGMRIDYMNVTTHNLPR